jgi:hypothetical protein
MQRFSQSSVLSGVLQVNTAPVWPLLLALLQLQVHML